MDLLKIYEGFTSMTDIFYCDVNWRSSGYGRKEGGIITCSKLKKFRNKKSAQADRSIGGFCKFGYLPIIRFLL
jgi:hypothetical protein